MRADIAEKFRSRFIPCLQLHEFEALLFTDFAVFDRNFTEEELNRHQLCHILNTFPNPEEINDSPQNAPSKRLKNLIEGFDKVVYGSILAEEIGLRRLREKSPRFGRWIAKLEALG